MRPWGAVCGPGALGCVVVCVSLRGTVGALPRLRSCAVEAFDAASTPKGGGGVIRFSEV